MSYSILVIEDDEAVLDYIKKTLLHEGYSVQTSTRGIQGLELVQSKPFDLVILDLQLPDMQGESICKEIKEHDPELQVIILTAKDSLHEKLEGFSLGADDYVTKPFATEELMARVKARLRKPGGESNKLVIADLELDSQKIEVRRGGEVIALTPQEFKLLEYLMQNQGNVLSREMILNKVWDYSFDVESRVVDVYVGYLRKKIDHGKKTKLIHSVRGFGYTIKV